MKKILAIISFLFIASVHINAENIKTVKIDGVRTDDKFKIGLVLGYPTGLTAGLRGSDNFEMNFVLATHYTDLTLGLSPMFTIVNFDIAGEIFPMSIGPAAYLGVDFSGGVDIDILGIVRFEYSFKKIPLNLFMEGGAGIKIDLGAAQVIKAQGSGAFGIRYIF